MAFDVGVVHGVVLLKRNGTIEYHRSIREEPAAEHLEGFANHSIDMEKFARICQEVEERNRQHKAAETKLLDQPHPLRLSYVLHKYVRDSKPTHQVLHIRQLLIDPVEFPAVRTKIWDILDHLKQEHKEGGKIEKINLERSWMLSDPVNFGHFSRWAAARKLRLTPEIPDSKPPSLPTYFDAVGQSLPSYIQNVKTKFSRPEDEGAAKDALAFFSPLRNAVDSRNRSELTSVIYRLTRKIGEERTAQLLPKIFLNFRLLPARRDAHGQG